MKSTKAFNILIIALLSFTLFACAGKQVENNVKGLLIAQDVIVSIAESADALCSAGALTQTQCDNISKAYDRAKVFYNLAEISLETAIKTDSPEAWDQYAQLHENFDKMYMDLLNLAVEFGIETGVGNLTQ